MEVIYHAACSLDGFIATLDGGVEWLTPFQGGDEDHGLAEFYESVDSLLLGSRTYEFALRHPPWMAPDKRSWVFTGRKLEVAHETVTLTSAEPRDVVSRLAAEGLERAWLMGGGALAASFSNQGLITSYRIAMVPIALGSGVPLFGKGAVQQSLRLTDTHAHSSGIVELSYEPHDGA